MLKINYPVNKEQFHNDYLAIFSELDLTQVFCGKSVKELLIMSIEDIIDFKVNINCQDTDIENIFKYNDYQRKIAQFFMKYQKEFYLSTCYFCNINYIYSFKTEYCNVLDFLLYASKSELEQVTLIGTTTSKKIIDYRQINDDITSIDNFGFLTSSQKNNIDSRVTNQYNHFTLDHLIEKSSHPIFALSLYNLIPSCSVCNSKFKHSISLVEDSNDHKFIPSFKDNKFDDEVKFRLYFDVHCMEDMEIDLTKIKIVLKSDDIVYRKHIATFKLYSRYQHHTNIVEELIVKSKKYSKTKIEQMATILKRPVIEIKQDIFGNEIFSGNLTDKPLTKLKRDICKGVGVL